MIDPPPLIRDLESLDERIRDAAREFIAKAKDLGFEPYETYRDPMRQAYYYIKGRTYVAGQWTITTPNLVVTKAKPLQSPHNFGFALDLVRDTVLHKWKYQGQEDRWQKLGALGKALGFEWGGDWRAFKDYPHFQLKRWQQFAPKKRRVLCEWILQRALERYGPSKATS
jgi:peptidoglycan L-alanyl-D-glutamate endopeptidase CwlK